MTKIMGVDFRTGDAATEQQARASLCAKWEAAGGKTYSETVAVSGQFKSIEWKSIDG